MRLPKFFTSATRTKLSWPASSGPPSRGASAPRMNPCARDRSYWPRRRAAAGWSGQAGPSQTFFDWRNFSCTRRAAKGGHQDETGAKQAEGQKSAECPAAAIFTTGNEAGIENEPFETGTPAKAIAPIHVFG